MPRREKTTNQALLTICDALLGLRKANKLTQQQLADMLGWDRSDISAIENGYAAPVENLRLEKLKEWWEATQVGCGKPAKRAFKNSIELYFRF